MTRPRHVRIVEVGPRDGLQNEPKAVPAPTKIAFIEMLVEAGLSYVEAGAFVSPKAVPQMADTMDVMTGLKRREGVVYPVLAPNLKGLDAAIKAEAEEVAAFTAASEAFTKANTNCTIDEALERAAEICDLANENNIRVRGYISCVMGCPYEGHVDPGRVADLAEKLMAMGCYGVSLGDTVGYGTPDQARDLIDVVAKAVPHDKLGVHFHDTYGQALSNILAVLDQGITVIDSAVAGLGGCPYAPGAAGNVATEDVLYMLDGLGVETGVDLEKVAAAGRFICGELGRQPATKVAQALAAKAVL
jgi:isopropylmalate/homocitrate/citramalate synthase